MPKKIYYNNEIFELNKCNEYDNDGEPFIHYINYDFSNINEEVEIIEEPQDIDIQAIEEINITSYKGFVETCRYIEKKGNEIIQAIKQLDNKIRKE